jgi:hypothetical protein
VPVLFHTGSALGIHPSEPAPSKGIRYVSARKHPLTVSPAGIPDAVTPGRLGRLRFLGFDPSESLPRPDVGLARRPLEAPMGFALLGFADEGLDPAFTESPLSRFACRAITRPPRRRPRVSINLRLAPSCRPASRTTRMEPPDARVYGRAVQVPRRRLRETGASARVRPVEEVGSRPAVDWFYALPPYR